MSDEKNELQVSIEEGIKITNARNLSGYIGLNNTIRYEYNIYYGMMKCYQISYNHSLAFSFELKSYTLGGLDPFFLTLIIISSISTIILTIFFLMRRRKYKRKRSRKKINKTLKKIK